jgi:hypothetical protein
MDRMNRIVISALARAFLVGAAAVALFGTAGPAAAQAIVTQGPCVSASGYCLGFTEEDDAIPVVRSVVFNAPSAGTAMVRFHGSVVCFNQFFRPAVVDLVSQIVTKAAAVPDPNGPGGLRHAIVFTAGSDPLFGGIDKADTFNLRSTRVVEIAAAGPRKFFFKIASLRMDSATSCVVYNAAFSIVFVP